MTVYANGVDIISPYLRTGLGSRAIEGGGTAATSNGIIVTGNAVANTKGDYAELIAATDTASDWLLLMLGRGSATAEFLIDISTGAAASEVVLISNLQISTGGTINPVPVLIPIYINAGTRISARCQSTTAGGFFSATAHVITSKSPQHFGRVATTYGAATADSGGTSIDPGAVALTKGSYVQLTASTTSKIEWLVISFGNQANTARTSCGWLVDIATGAGGSEVVKVPNIHIGSHSQSDTVDPVCLCLPVSIPAGTRIAVRAECSTNDATDRLIDVTLVGIG